MVICVPVNPDDTVDPRWGRAARVAVAEVVDGAIESWRVLDVGWDRLHDEGTEGGHHARVATFLRDHGVNVVVADHMGEPMLQMLARLGIEVRLGARGAARAAVLGGGSAETG